MIPRYESHPDNEQTQGEYYASAIEAAWEKTFPPEILASAFGGAWEKNERSRAPYTDAWTLADAGITLFAGISLNHCCVEISGSGCERLIQKGLLEKIVGAVANRVTRIDIASDIEAEVSPEQFVSVRSHSRMRSGGKQYSSSGETEYVGSRSSDRFARVYRYKKPHPRAHLLRVEHEFHRDYAKKVAHEILNSSLQAIAASAGQAFGWSHEVWDITPDESVDLSIVHAERNAGKTVFWLVNSVAPAFKRLCDAGVISDPEAFVRQFFLSQA